MQNTKFEKEFNDTFEGRFRIRWSSQSNEYQIEQRIAAQKVLDPPTDKDGTIDTFSDGYIRARDGYFYVMSVRPGTTMPCPICRSTVDVPVMVTAESTCHYCKVMGRDGRYKAAYYPLNHVLIEHIKDIDPDRNGVQRIKQRLRAAQIRRQEQLVKTELDNAVHNVDDNKNQLNDYPMTGYGPKTAQRGDGTRMEM